MVKCLAQGNNGGSLTGLEPKHVYYITKIQHETHTQKEQTSFQTLIYLLNFLTHAESMDRSGRKSGSL